MDAMSYSPGLYENRTRFTNYSSVTSMDAYINDFHVSYTPGVPSPKQSRRPTRFSRNASTAAPKQANISQSYILPTNIPNTSQIMPDQGALPNIQVHYNIPADEKQIVASLRGLQRDLSEALQTIQELTRERDEAVKELRSLKGNSKKQSSPPRRQQGRSIEQELFDLSSPLPEPPSKPMYSKPQSKKEQEAKTANISDDARVLPPIAINRAGNAFDQAHVSSKTARNASHKKTTVGDIDDSVVHAEDNPTAVSNTSRRRRQPSVDENMTSAYIIPDITVEQPPSPVAVSKAAQTVLHSLDPEHISNCDVCYRLTKHIKASEARKASASIRKATAESRVTDIASTKARDFANTKSTLKPDYTAALAGFVDESFLGDATTRPKMHPSQALLRVKILMDAQFRKAKERHRLAWEKYDKIEAPLSSKKHNEVSKEMQHWAEKMEECRVHLDYLRDVEEGMKTDDE